MKASLVKVYPGLLERVSQGGIENELKARRGDDF